MLCEVKTLMTWGNKSCCSLVGMFVDELSVLQQFQSAERCSTELPYPMVASQITQAPT